MIDTAELLNRLWKRAEEGYYDDKPVYQFSKDELNLRYYLGRIDEESYHLEKQKLEQRINEYNCCKRQDGYSGGLAINATIDATNLNIY